MATTDLKFNEPGSLPKPGPIGRLARLAFGAACLWYVIQLANISSSLIASDGHIRQMVWNGVAVGLFLVSYVVNIGFSRAWRKWPAVTSAVGFVMFGVIGYFVEGAIETQLLARFVWLWELYVFSHLGVAFVLAASIGTPGCEMRAFHDLFSRLSGIPTKEHYCPVGPLNPIDRWEAELSKRP